MSLVLVISAVNRQLVCVCLCVARTRLITHTIIHHPQCLIILRQPGRHALTRPDKTQGNDLFIIHRPVNTHTHTPKWS